MQKSRPEWRVRAAITGLCLAGIWFFGVCSLAASEPPRPNIILLMGDDHGWDETGYNGHPHLKTPVLDEMAASGLQLDRFYAAHPSCSPTRGSVLTGRHPNRYGTFTPNYSIRPEEITIAHLLRQAGYATGHFGKWHIGPVKAASPTNPGAMGFDEWLSHDNFFELNPWFSRNGAAPEQFHGESSEIIVAEAIDFIQRAKSDDKAFFTVIWFGSPHEPYSGLQKDLALYDTLPTKYNAETVRLTSNETGLQTQRPLRAVLQERYAEIMAMDRAIGQLRDWLDDAELRDNTLLWYCGDNGTPAGGIITSPFRGSKGNMYEGGIRVPAVIEWPARIRTPIVTSVPAVTSDMLPTLCQLAGVPLPDRPLDGISLTTLIAGQMQSRPQPIFFWAYDRRKIDQSQPYIEPALQVGTTPLVKLMNGKPTRTFRNYQFSQASQGDLGGERVVMNDRYKLVLGGDRRQPDLKELFDLEADPAEQNNLYTQQPVNADSMSTALLAWQTAVLNSLTGIDYAKKEGSDGF